MDCWLHPSLVLPTHIQAKWVKNCPTKLLPDFALTILDAKTEDRKKNLTYLSDMSLITYPHLPIFKMVVLHPCMHGQNYLNYKNFVRKTFLFDAVVEFLGKKCDR
jgi:hypothetical protein